MPWSLSEPDFLRIMEPSMLPFIFVDRSPSYDAAEVFYIRVDPAIELVDELLAALYYLLWFPGYFGFNWDALDECLRDLSWIPCHKVVIVHESVPKLKANDLKIYLEVLRDSVLDWSEGEAHELEVVFKASDRSAVESAIKI